MDDIKHIHGVDKLIELISNKTKDICIEAAKSVVEDTKRIVADALGTETPAPPASIEVVSFIVGLVVNRIEGIRTTAKVVACSDVGDPIEVLKKVMAEHKGPSSGIVADLDDSIEDCPFVPPIKDTVH